MIRIILALIVCTVAFAGDADGKPAPNPLPADAQKVLDQLDKDVAKLKEKASKDLAAVQDKETRAGHLEGALAIKEAAAKLVEKPKAEGKGAVGDIDVVDLIVEAKYGAEQNTVLVTDLVKAAIGGKDGAFTNNNGHLDGAVGGDPAPGATKFVTITFKRADGATKKVILANGQTIKKADLLK